MTYEKTSKKRACQELSRITKNTFLSMLPSYPDPNYVLENKTGNKVLINTIKNINFNDLKNGLYSKKYTPIEQSQPKKLLMSLKDSDWYINSFDPIKGEVCFTIKNKVFSHTIYKKAF